MSEQWVEVATSRLRDQHACPGCGAVLTSARCGDCGLALTGPWAVEVLRASREAAFALERRASALGALRALSTAEERGPAPVGPGRPRPIAPRPLTPVHAGGATPTAAMGRAEVSSPARSSLGLQPILASAGAGLLAVATIVFVFFTLADDLAVRALVTGVVTLLALSTAAFLRTRGMGASAESIGALGVVLLLVDVELVVSARLLGGADPAIVRGVLLLLVVVGLLAAGHRVRMRSWVAAGLILSPVVPVILAGAFDGLTASTFAAYSVALLAASLVTVLDLPFLRRSRERLGSPLTLEQTVLDVVRFLAFPTAVGLALLVPPVPGVPGWSGAALLVLVAAGAACVLARSTGQRVWWCAAGGATVLAGVLLGIGSHPAWLGTAPVAGLLAGVVLVGVATRARTARRTRAALVAGGAAVLGLAALPAAAYGLTGLLVPVSTIRPTGTTWSFTTDRLAEVGTLDDAASTAALVGVAALLLAMLGVGRLRLGTTGSEPTGPVGPDEAREAGSVATSSVATAPSAPTTTVPTATAPTVSARTGLVGAAGEAAPWTALVLVLGVALHPAWAAVTSFVALAVLALALFVVAGRFAQARRASTVATPAVATRTVATPVAASPSAPATATQETPARRTRAPWPLGAWAAAALTGAFVATGLAALVSWAARPTVVLSGAVVLALLLFARRTVPAPAHPFLVGGGYAYALLVLGTTLGWAGLGTTEAVAVVSVTASVVAIVVTRVRAVGQPSWWAVLVTTSVPFLMGVATVLDERSWWSATAAATMLALEGVLVLTRRSEMARAVRVAAAGLLLPTASVVLVCLGAELVPGSASPVVLPLVAILTAAAVVGVPSAQAYLTARGLPDRHVLDAGRAVEVSVLVTASLTVVLALVRVAAGPETAAVVLLVLGAGAAVVAGRPSRRWAWWVAGGLWVGALWSLLALLDVGLVEAYTAPPALAAVVVGGLLARRSPTGRHLAACGLGLLVLPSLLVSILVPEGDAWRNPTILALGLLLVAAGETARRLAARGTRVSATWAADAASRLALAAILASVAGLVAALQSTQAAGDADPTRVYLVALAWSAAGAALSALAGDRLVAAVAPWGDARRETEEPDGAAPHPLDPTLRRWWAAPALVLAVVGPVGAVGQSWTVIALAWLVEVALLVLVVHTVRRAVATRRREDLRWPPTWFVWALALTAAIGAWSPRELRVEVFSLPLGAGLLVAGYLAFAATTRAVALAGGGDSGEGGAAAAAAAAGAGGPVGVPVVTRPRLADWPVGYAGSWRTLAVGIAATLGPSVLATSTDARTWRAVLVIGLALAAVLVGTRFHLAAPFVLGVVVLPIEILVVFVGQLGTAVSAGPWMLTLTAAGGLLLIIAVYYERRMAAFDGAAAYLRDLR
ncbi:SCO7613 C-terminal domain-containing membrane protein [Oerskovia sp. NPDC057915]|uniref:SCO7613 C-terminal domain-containing membrane protein n=1 Tax=Oerskovia sp. NPDC057915 TaxID=3346280 RepID=UPI0036DAF7F4